MPTTTNPYGFVEQMSVSKFDTAHTDQLYLLEIGERSFQVSRNVHDLIQALQRYPDDLKKAAVHYSEGRSKQYAAEEIKALADKFLLPFANIESTSPEKKIPLTIHQDLLQEKALLPFTNLLRHLFFRPLIVSVFVASFLVQLFFLIQFDVNQHFIQNWGHPLLLVYNGIAIALLFFVHELGHLSACRYFGTRHGAMGIGLYLYFPVFYADVSRIWRLSGAQRMLVNLGGIYFQLFLLLPLTLLNIYVFDFTLTIAIFFNYLSILYNLNPIFKFDGYWFVSDWLGVPNLRDRSKEVLAYFYAKYIKKSEDIQQPYLLRISPRKQGWVVGYTIISVLFFSYIFFWRLPVIIWSFLQNLPAQIKQMSEILHNWYQLGQPLEWTVFWQFLLSLLIFVLCSYLVLRLAFRIYRRQSAA